jgi:hypothetical protein
MVDHVKRPRSRSCAGLLIEHGEPSYSPLTGFCERCGRACQFPTGEYGAGLCVHCLRGEM